MKKKKIVKVKEGQAVVVVRKDGEFHRVLGQGKHMLNPFTDRLKIYMKDGNEETHVSLKEVSNLKCKCSVKTVDDVPLILELGIDFKINSPKEFMYGMPDNYPIPLVTGCQKAVQDFVLQISIKDFCTTTTCLDKVIDELVKEGAKLGCTVQSFKCHSITPTGEQPERLARLLSAWNT